MNELLQVLAEKLKTVGMGSKVVALLVGLALVITVGVTAVVSNKPHYELTFSGLSDHEVARVNKALSEAGIAFEVSQPPSPFSVYVGDRDRSAAYKAAYGAGALDKPLKGIMSESGVSSVFQGSEERLQSVRKREWEEMEGMLELLDFVVSARVRTSPGDSSPLANKAGGPTGASVTLRVAGARLTAGQSQTVAELVSRGLGVDKQYIVISDQEGNQLFGGTDEEDMEQKVSELLAHRERHDQQATQLANQVLTEILGPDKAHIAVRSEWDYDQSTIRTETPSGKGSLISEHKNTSETPIQTPSNNVAGIAANVAEGENSVDGSRAPAALPAEPLIAKTSQEDKEYKPTLKTEERVRFVPTLTRLSVAVFLDESIDEGLTAQLQSAIKAAVGFVETRDDFQSVRLPFVTADESELDGEDEQAPSEQNPMMEMLLERGIEIAVSLVFVFLLLKSLKKSASVRPGAAGSASAEPELDVELLARAKVEELLKADPEQVGSILSSWANADEPVGGAKT